MSIEMCVLGSGSAGNSTVVRTPHGIVMIDAGFGPRTTAQRLHGTGVQVGDIAAICLTHLDSDHFNPNWLLTIVQQKIRIHCHKACAEGILEHAASFDGRTLFTSAARQKRHAIVPQIRDLLHAFADKPFAPIDNVQFTPIHLPHDRHGSHGFVIHAGGQCAGYATDMGHVPDTLIEKFCGVDVLAIESNYDPEMEEQSDRPYYLKKRIMGGAGHLSNQQAFDAVQRILDQAKKMHGAGRGPRHIVLLHRSRQCNCPKLLRRLFERDERIGPVLTLAEQYERTEWLGVRHERPHVGTQMALAWA